MRHNLSFALITIVASLALSACDTPADLPSGGLPATDISSNSNGGGSGGADVTGGGGTCTPNCVNRECGDDGCGGSCGDGCTADQTCTDQGLCSGGACQPNCVGRSCGDDGCGGSCGDCATDETCDIATAQCVSTCAPDCAGRQCGDDGCGGSCGDCTGGQGCDVATGQCSACTPALVAANCEGRACGDDGCGGSCGTCATDEDCVAFGQCAPRCVPDCGDHTCGDDGCGGSCGSCDVDQFCVDGACANDCTADCGDHTCGDDGCGGSCGSCDADQFCVDGACANDCTADCGDHTCGDDGCGGSCGACDASETCVGGTCQAGTVAVPVGAACTADSDCGEGGHCLLDGEGLPSGYCTVEDCEANGCPEGASCWNFQSGGSYCLLTCAESGDCREDDGYICDSDSTCWPGSTQPTGDSSVGDACASDADCSDTGASCYPETYNNDPTGFLDGYCVIFECSDENACPAGAACFQITDGTVCLDSCNATSDCREGYACQQNACLPACSEDSCPDGYVCGEDGVCVVEPCTPGSCPDGQVCTDGACMVDLGDGPGAGPGPVCDDLPPDHCTGSATYCGELIQFDPANNPSSADYDPALGYIDYAENGETWDNQYRSWLRRENVMALQYALAKIACKTASWEVGNGMPLGFLDMSEENGAIPGTSINQPGHPEGTHTNGFDIDVAYFQVGTSDNRGRPICEHYENGQEAYHCTAPPASLDAWRQALLFGYLHELDSLRVVGVDGKAGPMIVSALRTLCAEGWIEAAACNPGFIAYEETDGGRGWFYFHHHHSHLSFVSRTKSTSRDMLHLIPGGGKVTMDPVFDLQSSALPTLPAGLDIHRP